MKKGNAINKKVVLILVSILVLAIAGHLILPVLGEGSLLLLETLELTVDTLFEELLDFAPESAQIATAWIGLITLVALLVLGGLKLKATLQSVRKSAPSWWANKLHELQSWWESLVWYHQVLAVAYGVGLLFLLLLIL